MPTFQRLLRTLVLAALPLAADAAPVTLMHVHGLAWSPDGKQLMVPSHHGLAVHANGRWSRGPGPEHDYMGFAATKDSLYSSGHPAPGSGLVNPFGVIRSRDGGKSWDRLGLEREADFHLMAASHGTNALYVHNEQPNSRMRAPGLYYTLNDGMRWQPAAARGLAGEPGALAVHPSDARTVAAGTPQGLFLSRDAGQTFQPAAAGKRTLAAHFDLDGQHLWFSTHAGKPGLARIALAPGAKAEDVALPPLREDAVAYIAQNPARRDEIAIATFRRSVYVSPDRGRTWKQIAAEGVGKDG